MGSEQDVRKVEELWFDDADVIFQAGNLQFRVHRGILSARSPIFKDMFSIPQPESRLFHSDDGTLNAKVIHLSDDAQEVHYFFLAIFDSSFFEPPPSPTTMEMLAAILRLSHKYEVKYLLHRAVAHLDLMFPTDIHARAASPIPSNDYDLRLDGTKARLSLLRLIQPAYAASIRWILPSLFRQTAKIDLRDLFTSLEWRGLSLEVQEKFLIFRDIVRGEFPVAFAPMRLCLPFECTNREKCLRFSQIITDAFVHISNPSDHLHIRWSSDTMLRSALETGFCKACAKSFIDLCQNLDQACWCNYPSLLGLTDWQTLNKEKKAFNAEK